MYRLVFIPLVRVGTFTQAMRAPLDFVKFSISWGRTVKPPESVKTMSFPLAWASVARSASEERLIRTGKLVRVPEIIAPLMVSFFRPVQLQGLMARGALPPPPQPAPVVPLETKRSGRFWLAYSVVIQDSERPILEIRTSSICPHHSEAYPV